MMTVSDPSVSRAARVRASRNASRSDPSVQAAEDLLELIHREHSSVTRAQLDPSKRFHRVLAWTHQGDRPSIAPRDASGREDRQDPGA